MAAVIRLKRLGTKKKPHSRIIVCESSRARDAREIDRIGFYDPSKNPPLIQVDKAKAEKFDLMVIDPPPLAKRKAHLQKASRAYKDINRLGLSRLAPGGIMLTFSCSAHVNDRLFRQIVFSAALEADRQVRLLQTLGPGPDHPVSIYHPEGEYLTGFLLCAD